MYHLRSRYRHIAALALAALCAWASAALAGPIEDDYAVAARHYSAQRYAESVAEFRKLLAAAPQHPLAGDIRFFLAESLLQTDDADGAAKQFAALVAEHPQHRYAAQASFRIAEVSYMRGDYAAALPKLKAFVAAQGNHPLCEHALPYLGDCQLELGHPQEAHDAYQLALKQFPAGARVGECRLGLARQCYAVLRVPHAAERITARGGSRDPTRPAALSARRL
jgi:TolA-binding protein